MKPKNPCKACPVVNGGHICDRVKNGKSLCPDYAFYAQEQADKDRDRREKQRQESEQYKDACANESANEQVRRDSAAPERTP
jgi:hypothetical protein